MENIKRLQYGQELRLEMKDGERRVVTVQRARATYALVKEAFHGEYILKFADVKFVYIGKGLYPGTILNRMGEAQVEHLEDALGVKPGKKGGFLKRIAGFLLTEPEPAVQGRTA